MRRHSLGEFNDTPHEYHLLHLHIINSSYISSSSVLRDANARDQVDGFELRLGTDRTYRCIGIRCWQTRLACSFVAVHVTSKGPPGPAPALLRICSCAKPLALFGRCTAMCAGPVMLETLLMDVCSHCGSAGSNGFVGHLLEMGHFRFSRATVCVHVQFDTGEISSFTRPFLCVSSNTSRFRPLSLSTFDSCNQSIFKWHLRDSTTMRERCNPVEVVSVDLRLFSKWKFIFTALNISKGRWRKIKCLFTVNLGYIFSF